MIEAIERQIKPAILAVMTSVAALTGMGAGQPRNAQRTLQKAPVVQRAKVSSGQVKKARSPQTQRISRGTPVAVTQDAPTEEISIPWMPELTFSNKFANSPIPQVENAEYYRLGKYRSDRSKYNSAEATKCHDGDILRKISPYIPDIFYEKSKLSYAERIQFLNSPEKKKIMKALQERFETNIGTKIVLDRPEPLMPNLLKFCDQVLIFGRPLVSLTTETESLREAVDVCGMTQLGLWMDIQKAKRRELKNIMPKGYNEKEADEQGKYVGYFILFYPNQYEKAVGEWAEKPIRSDLPYFSEADFAHLTPEKKKELLELFDYMPHEPKSAPGYETGQMYQIYTEMRADKTGYRYIQERRPGLSKEEAAKVQKLAMEMVLYRRPLALLRAENYTLEQVIQVCQFRNAEIFYGRQQKGERMTGEIYELGFTMGNLQAKALMSLGKKFNHSDWVEFGQEMYDAYQKRIVVKDMKRPVKQQVIKIKKIMAKHDDSQMIDNRVAKAADAPRVREQDDSTNATSRVKRDANKGMK